MKARMAVLVAALTLSALPATLIASHPAAADMYYPCYALTQSGTGGDGFPYSFTGAATCGYSGAAVKYDITGTDYWTGWVEGPSYDYGVVQRSGGSYVQGGHRICYNPGSSCTYYYS